MEPIRNEHQEIVGYREQAPGGRVNVRNKNRELVGWTQFDQTRNKDGTLASFQKNEGLLYMDLD
jgi:hypothetical protein